MSNTIANLLDTNLKRETLKKISFNPEHNKHEKSVIHLIDSDKKCYDFDKFTPNNNSVDAIEINESKFYLIEFKDESTYNSKHDWKKIAEIILKAFQSINSILGLCTKNDIQKSEFHNHKLYFLVVFSSLKSTDLNDLKTLKTFLKEKYGNIFTIDILNEKMFIEDYVNTNKVGT